MFFYCLSIFSIIPYLTIDQNLQHKYSNDITSQNRHHPAANLSSWRREHKVEEICGRSKVRLNGCSRGVPQAETLQPEVTQER